MSFSEILGHDTIIEVLRRTIRSGKMAHSYIFEGISGIGRRKTAMAFIQALYCEQKSDNGCGKCSSCRKIFGGNHPDIHILEPLPDKRDIAIDQVREFQRELNLRPYEAPRKACLIEPADKMNANSANSLLKTLEEPPGNALIILLTENANILLPTIRSRCQLLHFSPLSPENICLLLKRHNIASDKAEILAVMSEGSIERALKHDNEELPEKQRSVFDRISRISSNNISMIFETSELLSASREETLQSIDIIISFFRDLVYLLSGDVQIINNAFKNELKQLAKRTSLLKVLEMLDLLLETRRNVQRNANAKLALDCMSLKMADLFQATV